MSLVKIGLPLPASSILPDYKPFNSEAACSPTIEKERRVGLAFETRRWFGLVRTERNKEVMTQEQKEKTLVIKTMSPYTLRLIFSSVALWLMLPAAVFAQQANTLTQKEIKEGWVLLFDGVGTTGWTTPGGKPVPAGWVIENGTLMAKKGAKGGDIISGKEYADFDLMADYNIEPTGNSGIKYFYTKYETGGNLGMEYQLLDDKLAEDNKKENHLTGSFYDVLPPMISSKKVNEPGQWNTIRILAKGNKVEHWLNGVKILEFVRGSQSFTEAVALSKFNKAVPAFGTVKKGHILLQEHGHEVSFRNIKIREL